VCGDPVFYFQNEFGSRVFFDNLGPPWPKHGCTNNDAFRYRSSVRVLACTTPGAKSSPHASATEWRQYAIFKRFLDCLILHDLETDEYLRVDILPERLTNIFPVVSVSEQSKELLTLSYYHVGVRSSIFVADIAFKRVKPKKKMSRASAVSG
jgi:hypothetical protein